MAATNFVELGLECRLACLNVYQYTSTRRENDRRDSPLVAYDGAAKGRQGGAAVSIVVMRQSLREFRRDVSIKQKCCWGEGKV